MLSYIKKEINLTNIIAFGILVIAILTYLESKSTNEGYIVQAGGSVYTALSKDNDKCSKIISIPIEFHNSGKQAVSLKQLAPSDITTVLFTNNSEIIEKDKIKFNMHLSNNNIGVVPSYWIKKFNNKNKFNPSFSHINDLIKPNESYSFFIVIIITNYEKLKEYKNFTTLINLNAIFSNEQTLKINSAIQIDTQDLTGCS